MTLQRSGGDPVLRILDACMPKPSFHWSDHLTASPIRGVYTLSPVGGAHRPRAANVGGAALMHARPTIAHEQPESLPVWLHIYHVRGLKTIKGLNMVSRDILGLGGIFHSGVEVRGLEWCFGATRTDRSGVFCNKPGLCPFHHYSKSVYLGTARVTPRGCLELLHELAKEWNGLDYHLLQRNCNHFSLTLSQRLGLDSSFPEWLLSRRALDDLEAYMEAVRLAKIEAEKDAAKEAELMALLAAAEAASRPTSNAASNAVVTRAKAKGEALGEAATLAAAKSLRLDAQI